MADVIADAMSWLAGKLKSFAGQSVTYTRGATTASLTATVEQTAFRTSDLGAQKSKLAWSDADFVFTLADLTAAGIAMPPQQNDKIVYTPPGSGVAQTYRLHCPLGERPFKIDPYSLMVRVHTQVVAS